MEKAALPDGLLISTQGSQRYLAAFFAGVLRLAGDLVAAFALFFGAAFLAMVIPRGRHGADGGRGATDSSLPSKSRHSSSRPIRLAAYSARRTTTFAGSGSHSNGQ